MLPAMLLNAHYNLGYTWNYYKQICVIAIKPLAIFTPQLFEKLDFEDVAGSLLPPGFRPESTSPKPTTTEASPTPTLSTADVPPTSQSEMTTVASVGSSVSLKSITGFWTELDFWLLLEKLKTQPLIKIQCSYSTSWIWKIWVHNSCLRALTLPQIPERRPKSRPWNRPKRRRKKPW